jgi:hypothetical protein
MDRDRLFDLANAVESRNDFINLANELNKEYLSGTTSWENRDLSHFLTALSGFTRDMDGYYQNMGEAVDVEVISWRMAAQMLLAATVYS